MQHNKSTHGSLYATAQTAVCVKSMYVSVAAQKQTLFSRAHKSASCLKQRIMPVFFALEAHATLSSGAHSGQGFAAAPCTLEGAERPDAINHL